MKFKNLKVTKKSLLIILLSVFSLTMYSQRDQIAIQGIARDDNNTALLSQEIGLSFELYTIDDSNTPAIILERQETVKTDAFGVFSTTLFVGGVMEHFAKDIDIHLKIKRGEEIISDEKIKTAVYAISSTYSLNGVPTGSIMPYMGETGPPGWLLCNGEAIPMTDETLALRAMVGDKTPNLNGMFLRGIGKAEGGTNNNLGPTNLGDIQGDATKKHQHESGFLKTGKDGQHTHTLKYPFTSNESKDGRVSIVGGAYNSGEWSLEVSADDSTHQHNIEGYTSFEGDTWETRPINYGVNYIIKL